MAAAVAHAASRAVVPAAEFGGQGLKSSLPSAPEWAAPTWWPDEGEEYVCCSLPSPVLSLPSPLASPLESPLASPLASLLSLPSPFVRPALPRSAPLLCQPALLIGWLLRAVLVRTGI